MERPKCEWGGVGGCERPATWMVGFVHSVRFRLSCKDHLADWHKNGAGYWSAELRGFFGVRDHVIDGPENVGAEEVTLPQPNRATGGPEGAVAEGGEEA